MTHDRSEPSPCVPGLLPGVPWRACVRALATVWLALTAVPALAAPDLVVEALAVDPASGPNGTTVVVEATVRNQGDAEAAESVTRFRINTSPTTVSPTDTSLCSVTTPVVAAGASVVVECSKKLTLRPPGANYIWAIADVNKEIGQVETDNDRRNTPFTIDGNASDLVIAGLEVDPASAANGDEITVTVVVRNDGADASLASTTRIRISESDEALAQADPVLCNLPTPPIPAGEEEELECVESISSRPAGTNYVWAIADVNRQAGQADTSNDRATTPLEVSEEASDLVVDSITADPASAPPGEQVKVTVAIRNQGTRSASSSVTRLRMNQNAEAVSGADPQVCDDIQTSSINAGATKTLSCNGIVPEQLEAGLHYLWVIPDAGDTAGQSDRSNDRTNTEFLVEPPLVADLVVRSLTLNPTSGLDGTQVTVTARIANEGGATAAASKTRILVNTNADGVVEGDTVLCDQVSTVALSVGASVQVSCKPAITGRPYGINRIWAVADATQASGQTNTANDGLSAAFDVIAPPAPDLVVESLAASPSPAEPGQEVTVTARIRNQGTLPAAASTVRIQVNQTEGDVLPADAVVCTIPVPAISAGAARDAVCEWTVERIPGPWFLWARADVNATAGQIFTNNDTRSLPFEVLVPDGPNLVVKRLVVRPSSARNGERVLAKARVLNEGNEASDASTTTFRINEDDSGIDPGDQVLCEDVPTRGLAAGEAARVRCEALIEDRPIGPNRIWATADTTESAGDVDPRDDSRRAPFEVVDLVCSDSDAPALEWPVEAPRVLQDYASYGSVPQAGGRLAYHSGIDLVSQLPVSPSQTPVYAAADGEVVALRRNCPSPADPLVNPPSGRCAGGWGNFLVIRHGGDVFTAYAHLGAVFVGKGCVEAGQLLALAGSSGSVGLPVHVHFGVLEGLVEPIARQSLGAGYYRRYHPLDGRVPEQEDGVARIHLDARDFMERSRVRITGAVAASRGRTTGGAPAYLAAGQEYVSYGELVPGYFLIDLPYGTLPEDGPPYADDARYGWVPVSKIEVLETGLEPGSLRIDGYGLFADDGIGASFASVRDAASSSSAEVTKAYGNQQFVPSGAPIAENGNGRLWQAIDVPGETATGASGPREAFLPLDATSE